MGVLTGNLIPPFTRKIGFQGFSNLSVYVQLFTVRVLVRQTPKYYPRTHTQQRISSSSCEGPGFGETRSRSLTWQSLRATEVTPGERTMLRL